MTKRRGQIPDLLIQQDIQDIQDGAIALEVRKHVFHYMETEQAVVLERLIRSYRDGLLTGDVAVRGIAEIVGIRNLLARIEEVSLRGNVSQQLMESGSAQR
jgi:hypothetical protein